MKNKFRYLIVGNSAGAISALESIRRVDKEGSIGLFSWETYPPYSRPLLAKWLKGERKENRMYFRPRSIYQHFGAKAFLGVRVEKILPGENTILTSSGEYGFEKLLLTTGALPFLPPGIPRDREGIFTFTTWDEAKALQQFIQVSKPRRILVLGGGLIGLEVTDALVDMGIKVFLVELADRLLPATLDGEGSRILVRRLRSKGVEVYLEDTVVEWWGRDGIKGGVLKSGEKLEFEGAVIAVGVRPNVEMMKDAGMKVGRGIVVNEKMETSIPGIYAAGDVVEVKNLLSGKRAALPLWPEAVKEGRVAGINMAGGKAAYPGGYPMNAVEILGLPMVSMGITDTGGEGWEVVKRREGTEKYLKLVIKDNRIVGGIFFGDIEKSGIYNYILREGLDISPFRDKLLEDDFGIISLPHEFRKHLVTGPGVEV